MIQLKNVTKIFRTQQKSAGLLASVKGLFRREWRDKVALNNVSLDVEQGEVIGLIGANGAGKTTLVKILSGIVPVSSGDVSVLGFNPWARDNQFRAQMSLVMGQKAQLWWDLPAGDCFLMLKEIYQIPDRDFESRVAELSVMLDVRGELRTPIRNLSLGERMKMEIIAALLHQPRVLFLDEPTIGLDFSAQRALRSFMSQYQKEHRPTTVLTSHYMEDIEQLCKRIVILRDGGVVYDGALRQLIQDYAPEKRIVLHIGEALEAGRVPESLEGCVVKQVNQGTLEIRAPRDRLSTVAAKAMQLLPVSDLTIEEPDVASIIERIMRKREAA